MNYGALSSIPRKTTIGGQPHMLAYINPEEENIIQEYRGNLPVTMGPDGVPAYWSWGESSFNPSNWGSGDASSSAASTSSNDDDDSPGIFESVGNAISSGVSAVVGAVSDIGSAVVDVASDVGSAAVDTVTEIVTLGTADTATYNPDTTSTSVTTDTTATTTSTKSFDDAFAEARAAGLETFTWQGNVYSTDLATAPDPKNLQNIDAQISDLFSQGFTEDDPPVKALLEQKNTELANLGDKLSEGEDQVQDYIDKFGTSYLEDRFLTGRINPATGKPYVARDTNIVNPLDADTMPYTPGGLDDDEIIYIGGDPYSSTVDGVDIGTGSIVSTDDEVIDSGAYLANNFGSDDSVPQPYSTDIFGTRDIMGDFYGGRSGGMWERFADSYLARFGYSPEQFNEMIRKVENPDGTTSFFGADGAIIDPESIGSNYRLAGEPTSLKIGEEQVQIGTENYDAQGNLLSTNYTDAYNPDIDILAQG